MSYFDASNANGALVYEVETLRRLNHVLAVDTVAGLVFMAHQPVRLDGDQISSYVERYETIHAIYGSSFKPVLFHCYGLRSPRLVRTDKP